MNAQFTYVIENTFQSDAQVTQAITNASNRFQVVAESYNMIYVGYTLTIVGTTVTVVVTATLPADIAAMPINLRTAQILGVFKGTIQMYATTMPIVETIIYV